MKLATSLVVGVLASLSSATVAWAQNPNFPGYLGVYVVEGRDGMQITGFIRNTPAAELASIGEISRGDVIVKLAGQPTRSLNQLRSVRNGIPLDQEAKMVLRGPDGLYHVWISRSEAVAAAIAPDDGTVGSAAPGSSAPRTFGSAPPTAGAAPQAGAPDRFFKGGEGEGSDGDFRPKGGKPSRPESDGGDTRPKG